jgi:hypothetical protein
LACKYYARSSTFYNFYKTQAAPLNLLFLNEPTLSPSELSSDGATRVAGVFIKKLVRLKRSFRVTIFANLAKGIFANKQLSERGFPIYLPTKSGRSLFDCFERASTDSSNLSIHTRRSLRASAPVLNNPSVIKHLVSHCLERTDDTVRMSEYKMSDAKSEFSDLFTSLKTAEQMVWSGNNCPITRQLNEEERFLVTTVKNCSDPNRTEAALLFASELKKPHNSDFEDLPRFDEVVLELSSEFKEALSHLAINSHALSTQTIPYKGMEHLLADIPDERVPEISALGTKEHCAALIEEMGELKDTWLRAFESENGQIILRNYTQNLHWDMTMAMSFAHDNPIRSINEDEQKVDDFIHAYDSILRYEQTILKNLHPAHLAFLEAINPESFNGTNETQQLRELENLKECISNEEQLKANTLMPLLAAKQLAPSLITPDNFEELLGDILDSMGDAQLCVGTLAMMGRKYDGLGVYILYRLHKFHSLLSNSLKALILLSTETLLDSHDASVMRNAQAAQKPSYRKVSGKQAKAKKRMGLQPREIIASPKLTVVDYRVTGFERRRKSDLSLHKDTTGIRGTHTKSRHYVRPHYALLKERMLKSGELRPARTIYRCGHWRGIHQTTVVRKIK